MSLTITSGITQDNAWAWAKVYNVTNDFDSPGFFPITPEIALLGAEHPWPARSIEHYLGWLGDEPVALMELSFSLRENLTTMHLDIRVLPAHRRAGIGRRLYDLAIERAKANGRTKLHTHTPWAVPGTPDEPLAGPAFAESLGFASANLTEVMRRLDLSTADDAALEAMLDKARQAAEGYEVVQWGDVTPEELAADVAYLDGRLSTDAPMGDLEQEPSIVDSERIHAVDQVNINRGRKTYNTGAVDAKTGKLVAWTAISQEPQVPWHGWQLITIVDPDHRGHRLGALVKVENLRYFRQAEPGVEQIDTFNAASNGYMISINEDMGFRAKCAFANWKREI
jgi:GNAT superfamily N-acetyltransferase